MTQLSEIWKARDDDNPDQAYELWKQWHSERGIPHKAGSHREHYMRYIERLEAALEPFKSGEWGAWKAWMVEGAPTREEGILAAKTITKYQCVVDDLLAQHGREEAR